MIGAFICFGVAIAAIVVALTYKPKPRPSRRLTHQEMIADRQKILKRKPNNLGKVKNYDQGRGVEREKINEAISPKKLDISIAKFKELTRLVSGQEDAARRLIEGNLKLFPDKSPDWACDKAISDIERDRRTN